MKIHIEIVTGFLGAGKTTFINSLLSESQVDGERVIIFQLEQGIMKINHNSNLKVVEVNKIEDLKEKLIYSINKYKLNRIIIEYNGTSNLRDLITILNEKNYRKWSKITTIFFVADGRNLKRYIDNIGNFIIPFIQNANMVIVNNTDYSNNENLEDAMKKIKKINPNAYILTVNNKYILKSKLRESRVIDNGYLKKLRVQISNYKRNL